MTTVRARHVIVSESDMLIGIKALRLKVPAQRQHRVLLPRHQPPADH